MVECMRDAAARVVSAVETVLAAGEKDRDAVPPRLVSAACTGAVSALGERLGYVCQITLQSRKLLLLHECGACTSANCCHCRAGP